MAVAEPPVEQLAPDTVIEGGRPLATLSLEPGQLDERVQLDWHRGEDDLGPYDAAVLTADGRLRWALVSYRDSPTRGLIVIGEPASTRQALESLLAALRVRDSEVHDLDLPVGPPGRGRGGASKTASTRSEKSGRRPRRVASTGKGAFVRKVASQTGLSNRDAAAALDAVIRTIEEALKSGEDVSFTGFGKFHVAERGERHGRNPRTGEPMTIAASRVPRFTAGSGLKKAVG